MGAGAREQHAHAQPPARLPGQRVERGQRLGAAPRVRQGDPAPHRRGQPIFIVERGGVEKAADRFGLRAREGDVDALERRLRDALMQAQRLRRARAVGKRLLPLRDRFRQGMQPQRLVARCCPMRDCAHPVAAGLVVGGDSRRRRAGRLGTEGEAPMHQAPPLVAELGGQTPAGRGRARTRSRRRRAPEASPRSTPSSIASTASSSESAHAGARCAGAKGSLASDAASSTRRARGPRRRARASTVSCTLAGTGSRVVVGRLVDGVCQPRSRRRQQAGSTSGAASRRGRRRCRRRAAQRCANGPVARADRRAHHLEHVRIGQWRRRRCCTSDCRISRRGRRARLRRARARNTTISRAPRTPASFRRRIT